MKIYIAFVLIVLCACARNQPVMDVKKKEVEVISATTRYEVTLADPPIVHANVEAMYGNPGQWPSVLFLSKSGEIYKDDNYGLILEDNYPKRQARLGLGPSYQFNLVSDQEEKSKMLFYKSSMKITYSDNNINVDAYHDVDSKKFAEATDIDYSRNFFACKLSYAAGLVCKVKCTQEPYQCKEIVAWHQPEDPIIEINTSSYPGIYAITKQGKLLAIKRQGQEILEGKILHADLKFLIHNDGRYFINATSNSACLQSENLDIYCDVDDSSPGFEKLRVRPNFYAKEVAYSARHECILSGSGEVWCAGDNSCGQITGRHDEIQDFENLHKVDFLKSPAKQLFTYAGGTCALLIDGRVQCLGLGASVLRKRQLPNEKYTRSFAWHEGFRPENICAGGAENGI